VVWLLFIHVTLYVCAKCKVQSEGSLHDFNCSINKFYRGVGTARRLWFKVLGIC
jgi:hypothetical protein